MLGRTELIEIASVFIILAGILLSWGIIKKWKGFTTRGLMKKLLIWAGTSVLFIYAYKDTIETTSHESMWMIALKVGVVAGAIGVSSEKFVGGYIQQWLEKFMKIDEPPMEKPEEDEDDILGMVDSIMKKSKDEKPVKIMQKKEVHDEKKEKLGEELKKEIEKD